MEVPDERIHITWLNNDPALIALNQAGNFAIDGCYCDHWPPNGGDPIELARNDETF
jgi:hypothetical protein